MSKAYVLQGTENEYLVVIRTEDIKAVYKIIDYLSSSRTAELKELAVELEKSLHDDTNRRDSGKTRSKNKSQSTDSNKGRGRKAKDS